MRVCRKPIKTKIRTFSPNGSNDSALPDLCFSSLKVSFYIFRSRVGRLFRVVKIIDPASFLPAAHLRHHHPKRSRPFRISDNP